MDFREVSCDLGDWRALAEDRDQWRAYVKEVINLWLPRKPISLDFLTSSLNILREFTVLRDSPFFHMFLKLISKYEFLCFLCVKSLFYL